MRYKQTNLWTCHEGDISLMHIAMIGTMNQLQNENMKDKVRRSQRARVEEGRVPAGIPYGYKVDRSQLDGSGMPIKGLRKIDADQALVVRRIFKEYSDGKSVKSIVKGLNDEKISGFKGKEWRPVSLKGSATRQDGILYNSIYRGWLVHNKNRKVTDPKTGKSHYRPNPESERIQKYVPELRIVTDEIWEAVQNRHKLTAKNRILLSSKRKQYTRRTLDGTRAKPLTGLVYCGQCNGLKSVANDTRYICSMARYQRQCSNSRGIKEKILAECTIKEVIDFIYSVDDWYSIISNHFNEMVKQKEGLEKEAIQIEESLNRLLQAIESGINHVQATNRFLELQNKLASIKIQLDESYKIESHSQIKIRMIFAMRRIESLFNQHKHHETIRSLLQLIIKKIILTPITRKRSGETIDIKINPPEKGWPEFYRRIAIVWPDLE